MDSHKDWQISIKFDSIGRWPSDSRFHSVNSSQNSKVIDIGSLIHLSDCTGSGSCGGDATLQGRRNRGGEGGPRGKLTYTRNYQLEECYMRWHCKNNL